jgi:Tfp pilus assembly protein PilX
MNKKRNHQKGVALVFTLLLILVLSVMASSLMFLSQSETWSSSNYRTMSQSRYGAESGLSVAADFIVNQYNAPTAASADNLANYNTAVSPVTLVGNGQPVVLSSVPGKSIYPDANVIAAFQNAMTKPGNINAGNAVVSYTATATLLSMGTVGSFGTPVTVQMWKITADGSTAGVINSRERVSAILERQVTPSNIYAAFATSNGCSALSFAGGGQTNSYDSSTLPLVSGAATPPAAFSQYGGNVGANGNLAESGSGTTIYGTLSTPDTGVGNCSGGNVTAWTDNGKAQVTGGLVKLPQIVDFPLPAIPPPGTTPENINGATTLPPGNYGDISLTGKGVLTLTSGTYNINSISEQGSNTIVVIQPTINAVTGLYDPVILNVTGNNQTTPIDLTGNGLQNSTLNPGIFTINYAGTGTIKIAGNSASAAVVYAPAASVQLTGGSDFFGAIIGQTVKDTGGTAIHYDRNLAKTSFVVSNFMLDAFNWEKF